MTAGWGSPGSIRSNPESPESPFAERPPIPGTLRSERGREQPFKLSAARRGLSSQAELAGYSSPVAASRRPLSLFEPRYQASCERHRAGSRQLRLRLCRSLQDGRHYRDAATAASGVIVRPCRATPEFLHGFHVTETHHSFVGECSVGFPRLRAVNRHPWEVTGDVSNRNSTGRSGERSQLLTASQAESR